jgi:hypothetical protein
VCVCVLRLLGRQGGGHAIMADGAVQPLLKDGNKKDYGSKDKSDLYYMGELKEELYNTSQEKGLTTEEVQRRLKVFGKNELAEKEDNKW